MEEDYVDQDFVDYAGVRRSFNVRLYAPEIWIGNPDRFPETKMKDKYLQRENRPQPKSTTPVRNKDFSKPKKRERPKGASEMSWLEEIKRS